MDASQTIVIGATIATLVAIVKAAFPTLPSRALPLLVVVIAGAVVGVGAYSGEVTGTPFGLLTEIVQQAAAAIGIREGIIAAAPRAGALLAPAK